MKATLEYNVVPALRTMVAHAAQLCEMAGQKRAARRLAASPVNPGARYSCVIRFTRAAEMALMAGNWNAPIGGAALWAVMMTRAFVYRALTDPRPGLGRAVHAAALQLESEIRVFGQVPRGRIGIDAAEDGERELDSDGRRQEGRPRTASPPGKQPNNGG